MAQARHHVEGVDLLGVSKTNAAIWQGPAHLCHTQQHAGIGCPRRCNLRRAIQAVAEGRDPGDLTTMDDPAALQQIVDQIKG